MSKWKHTKSGMPDSTIDALMGHREYTYKNKRSGEERKVVAYSQRQAGERISKGKFKK